MRRAVEPLGASLVEILQTHKGFASAAVALAVAVGVASHRGHGLDVILLLDITPEAVIFFLGFSSQCSLCHNPYTAPTPAPIFAFISTFIAIFSRLYPLLSWCRGVGYVGGIKVIWKGGDGYNEVYREVFPPDPASYILHFDH